jgi:tetratricopeptide (TPR) repeat protein
MSVSFRSVLLSAGLVLLAPLQAFAQPSQNAMVAEALFEDGQKLMQAGKTAEACEKFAASQKLDPAIGTLLNLAACHEKLGRTATAWVEFNDAFAQSNRQGDKARAQFAKQHADALEKQLYRLTITVLKPNRNMSVKLDGNEIAKEAFGTAIPLDPGDHQVEATQAGRKPFRQTLHSSPGGNDRVEVPELPEIEYGMPHPDTAESAPPIESEPPPKKELSTGGGVNKPLLIGGVGAIGVGVGGIVTGVIFGVMALGQASDRDKICKPGAPVPCRDQRAFDLDYDAHVSQTMMFVFGGAGVALAATGGVLLGMSLAKKQPAQTGLVVVPSVGPHLSGIQLGGTF